MRIASSIVGMASRREWRQEYSRQESLRVWASQRPPDPGTPGGPALARARRLPGDRHKASAQVQHPTGDPATNREDLSLSTEDRVRLLILREILGIEVKLIRLHAPGDHPGAAPPQEQAPRPAVQHRLGIAYDLHESYRESERLEVRAAGLIRTADGKEVAFSVELRLSRSFAEERHLRIRAGDAPAVDPLVINFNGPAAALTQIRFRFDLDQDGQTDLIPFLAPGSGFLALDRNGDGLINHGGELFGPSTGDGLAELATLDFDGDGWIDEDDPIFSRLRIWTPDESGTPRLFALGQKGIGAIFTGGIAAPFAYTDGQNRRLAVNRSAGLFLREDGSAGTVQQLDFKL